MGSGFVRGEEMGDKTFYTEEDVATHPPPKTNANFIDRTGYSKEGVTLIKYYGEGKYFTRCSCNNIFLTIGKNVLRGRTNSCGCKKSERIKNLNTKAKTTVEKALKITHPHYDVINYGGSATSLSEIYCKVCQHKFLAAPSQVYGGRGKTPCKCSTTYRRTGLEYEAIAETSCAKKGLIFLGFDSIKPTATTRVKYKCTYCEKINLTRLDHIRSGTGCRSCSGSNQKQVYIFSVKDQDITIAYKYGIANDYKKRESKQNRVSVYGVSVLKVFEYETSDECRYTEYLISKEVDKNLLTKQEYPDGFTETTGTENLDIILKIHQERNGIELEVGEKYV